MIKLLWKDNPTAFSPMGEPSAHTRRKKKTWDLRKLETETQNYLDTSRKPLKNRYLSLPAMRYSTQELEPAPHTPPPHRTPTPIAAIIGEAISMVNFFQIFNKS